MARIDSAYFGDDKAVRNITESLRKKVVSKKLDVTANDQLIPTFEAAPETVLEDEDEKKIREQAVQICGQANQTCLEATKSKMRQERLSEKERTNMSGANIIKGRRLTVNVVDKDGKRRTMIVPDGQQLKIDDVEGTETVLVNGVKMPSGKWMTDRTFDLVTWVFVALVQVFGLAAFVMMLRDEAPVMWKGFLEGGWFSLAIGVFGCIILLALPFGPLGAVAMFYIGKGIINELKS